MMYSEFLEMSGKTESYISYVEYTTFIEPIYMECDLSKMDFIKLLNEAIKKIAHPIVERAIHNLPMDEKLTLIECQPTEIIQPIEIIDFKARKIAYEYMQLYTRV